APSLESRASRGWLHRAKPGYAEKDLTQGLTSRHRTARSLLPGRASGGGRGGEHPLVRCRRGGGLLGGELGGLRERGAERYLLEQPREEERHGGQCRAPEEDAVEGVREGLEKVGVRGGRQVLGLRGVEMDAAPEPGGDAAGEPCELVG